MNSLGMKTLGRGIGAGAFAGLLAFGSAACGGGQTRLNLFSTDWEDDRGASIARVWKRVGSAEIPASADVAVGVAGHADKILGVPLGGGAPWSFSHALDARPVVAGRAVVASGGGEIFALDAQTGALLWRRPTGAVALLGAGDDGAVTVVTFKPLGAFGSVLLAVGHDGQVVRQIETSRSLGVPAVVGRIAFVPWAGEYVSAIDLANGDESARVTLRAETSHAWTTAGALWFGEGSFIRFDDHIAEASRGKATTVALPLRELPGRPRLMLPGNQPVPTSASADDKARTYARPAAGSTPGVEDGRWYATYFRLAMGFEAASGGKLVWAHLHPADIIGGAAGPGGVLLCDEQGKLTALDASTGGASPAGEFGEPIQACVVNVDEQRIARAPAASPLASQLAEIVLADDPQLEVAQKLLLRELSALPDETATKALVELASDPRTSPDLLAEARTSLANRRNGATYMEAALARHYDFLHDVLRAPPVGPIAQALGAMKEHGAAPLLASHLLDPADTSDDMMRAAAALAIIGGPEEAATLRQFFALYRATAEDDDISAAVVSAGQALLDLEDKAGRSLVLSAAEDPTTVAYARERLQAVVSEQRQAQGAASADAGRTAPHKAK